MKNAVSTTWPGSGRRTVSSRTLDGSRVYTGGAAGRARAASLVDMPRR